MLNLTLKTEQVKKWYTLNYKGGHYYNYLVNSLIPVIPTGLFLKATCRIPETCLPPKKSFLTEPLLFHPQNKNFFSPNTSSKKSHTYKIYVLLAIKQILRMFRTQE